MSKCEKRNIFSSLWKNFPLQIHNFFQKFRESFIIWEKIEYLGNNSTRWILSVASSASCSRVYFPMSCACWIFKHHHILRINLWDWVRAFSPKSHPIYLHPFPLWLNYLKILPSTSIDGEFPRDSRALFNLILMKIKWGNHLQLKTTLSIFHTLSSV